MASNEIKEFATKISESLHRIAQEIETDGGLHGATPQHGSVHDVVPSALHKLATEFQAAAASAP